MVLLPLCSTHSVEKNGQAEMSQSSMGIAKSYLTVFQNNATKILGFLIESQSKSSSINHWTDS